MPVEYSMATSMAMNATTCMFIYAPILWPIRMKDAFANSCWRERRTLIHASICDWRDRDPCEFGCLRSAAWPMWPWARIANLEERVLSRKVDRYSVYQSGIPGFLLLDESQFSSNNAGEILPGCKNYYCFWGFVMLPRRPPQSSNHTFDRISGDFKRAGNGKVVSGRGMKVDWKRHLRTMIM